MPSPSQLQPHLPEGSCQASLAAICSSEVSLLLLYAKGLFVACLSYDTNEAVLKGAFERHGELIEVKVICDHKSGKSKGYGFVKFESETAASKALKEMDGQLLDGRSIRVHYAQKG
nr:glycine-rich RNA-binding protein 4, mitochondrial-like isoform X2 [Ipomoea batatas]